MVFDGQSRASETEQPKNDDAGAWLLCNNCVARKKHTRWVQNASDPMVCRRDGINAGVRCPSPRKTHAHIITHNAQ